MEAPTSIESLPEDCLFFIFQRLDCFSDRQSFGSTCRRWLNVQNLSRWSLQFPCSLTVLSRESLSRPDFNVDPLRIAQVRSRFPHLQSLSLSGCIYLTDADLALLQYGPSLRALNFDCCSKITDIGFSLAFYASPSLAAVSLYRCKITDLGLAHLAETCPGLEQVNLSYCSRISDLGLAALSRKCRRLREIKVSACDSVTGSGFTGSSPTLSHVEVISCRNLDLEGLAAMVSGGGVEFLNAASLKCDGLALAFGAGIASRLGVLDLQLSPFVGDESVSAISNGCPVLRELNLTSCDGVGLPGWESIGSNCDRLEILHVSRCRNFFAPGLLAIQNGCPRLRVLYTVRCPRLSPNAVMMFKHHRGDVTVKAEYISHVVEILLL